MNLKEYFENIQGNGLLATASSKGNVDIAVYSRPHFLENGNMAFIMRDRLTHAYLQDNSFATYAYIEDGGGYKGIRLFMKKTGEDSNEELIASMTRRHLSPEEDVAKGPKFVV